MNTKWETIALTCLLSVALTVGCDRRGGDASAFPHRPIKVIVPFAAGGGSDQFGRIIQLAIDKENLLPEKLVMINVPGAGGTIGSRRVKNARPDGYTILLLHEGIITAQQSGQAAYGPEAFAAIAGSGEAAQVVAVDDQSPYRNLQDLMSDAASRPGEIVFAANIGAPSHFAGLMLEQQKPGSQFRYTQTGGGAKRFAALKGGHVEVSSFSIAEYIQFRPAGMRAIAILGEQRHSELSELATAREQGFDVVSHNMQFWWAPKGTSPDRIHVIANAIEEAMRTQAVQEQLAQLRIDPRFLRGAELESEIAAQSARAAAVSSRKIDGLPNFPLITLGVVLVLAFLVGYQQRGGGANFRSEAALPLGDWLLSLTVLGLTIVYVMSLQFTTIGFRFCTLAYVVATGLAIARHSGSEEKSSRSVKRLATLLGCLAIVLSIGVHYLFTRVLVVDLP